MFSIIAACNITMKYNIHDNPKIHELYNNTDGTNYK